MFRSFFMAGFECATGLNRNGEWIDQICATEHDQRLAEDYRLVRQAGIRVVREGVRWPLIDRGEGEYDFGTLDAVLSAARAYGIDVILDLFHYGYPADLDPFSDEFVYRFSDYCRAVALRVQERFDGPYFFTPINEPSYFSWAAGDAELFAPHQSGRSYELKVQLARAAIMGIDAIHSVLPTARIVNADPLCHVAADPSDPDGEETAHWFNENVVFESLDMLAGRVMPELGGSPRHLDIVGMNYYWTNQWVHGQTGSTLPDDDPRRWPLRDLIRWVHHRYPGHDLIVSETAHVDENRESWMREMTDEVEASLNEGVPLRGVCLYPILGMPEWHEPDVWTRMGLWDLHPREDGLRRVPHQPSFEALRQAQTRLEGLSFAPSGVPRLLTGEHHLF